jgi:hypothetical protein
MLVMDNKTVTSKPYFPRPAYYSSDEVAQVFKNLQGLESFTFCFGGGKIKVWHDGEILVAATQTAKCNPWSAATLVISCREKGLGIESIGKVKYHRSLQGNQKNHAALTMLAECWEVNPSRDYLYEQIGEKTHHCACCGRTLTHPESMERGIGPECVTHIWGPAFQMDVIKKKAGKK